MYAEGPPIVPEAVSPSELVSDNDAAGAVEGNSPFQVVWLPDDARSLAAMDGDGNIVATRFLDGSDDRGADRRTKKVLVAGGNIDGHDWLFHVYGKTDAVCTQLGFEMPAKTRESGTCFNWWDREGIAASTQLLPESTGRLAITGVMTADIESIELKFANPQSA